jgi:tRNA(Ile2) C34 agmatinyltransferase TiaS
MEHVKVAGTQNRPICHRCGTRMLLGPITPDGSCSYECPKCEYVCIEEAADPLTTAKGWLTSKELKPPK